MDNNIAIQVLSGKIVTLQQEVEALTAALTVLQEGYQTDTAQIDAAKQAVADKLKAIVAEVEA